MEKQLDQFLKNPDEHWVCFVDGSSLGCTGCGSRGPSGSAALVIFCDEKKEFKSKRHAFLDHKTTNNIAELTAVHLALDLIEDLKQKPNVQIMTDSKYVQGVLGSNWKVKANVELIHRLKDRIQNLRSSVTFHWIKGHSNVYCNEEVDRMAKEAAKESKSKASSVPNNTK